MIGTELPERLGESGWIVRPKGSGPREYKDRDKNYVLSGLSLSESIRALIILSIYCEILFHELYLVNLLALPDCHLFAIRLDS